MEIEMGKLFIGGISWDTNEERMREYFQSFGDVLEAVIMKDRNTGRARGFGFVVFADPAVAERVVLEKHVIDGRTVEAKKAVPRDDQNLSNRNSPSIHGSPSPARTKKIFVGGLASTVTENDFKNYFDQFGTITDVVVMYDHNTQRPRGFGFITYESEDAVDKVLLKTFHELNGKMVEVKRAVPKELSPGPTRGPLAGYNPGLGRVGNLLSGYNQSPFGGYGMRMDGRYSPITVGRSGYSPLGPSNYGMGLPFDSGFGPGFGGGPNLGSDVGYGRMMNPVFSGNANRFGMGYGGAYEGRAVMNSPSRNLWGNDGLSFGNSTNPNAIGPGNGNSGAGLFSNGGMGSLWDSAPSSIQFGAAASTYNSGNFSRVNEDINIGSGRIGYGRNLGTGLAPPSVNAAGNRSFEEGYGNSYEGSSFYGNSNTTWRMPSPEPEGFDPFGYGLRSTAPEANPKDTAVYTDGYSVTNRQSIRGIAA
uniref:RRM domain-containing protein n=1 Tax=Kalanchoe fedtschenkoi TaxID=63787 RepID=A0A7N1A2B9_KALFE